MKKIAILTLMGVMVFSFAGCGKEEKKENTEITEETVQITDSLEILSTVWAAYGDDEKFAAAGGDYNNSVTDAPGSFDVSDVVSLDSMLGVPEDGAALIDKAASLIHMMNANTFTSGAYHLSDTADKQVFCDKLKDNIMNRQWMCGFPDTLIIVTVGDEYVVSAFGITDTVEIFKTRLLAEYPMAEVVYEESLAE